MFLFIVACLTTAFKIVHLNTSHVLIYRRSIMDFEKDVKHLNTSHVLIYRQERHNANSDMGNLNTSHVLIYRKLSTAY